MFVFEVNYELFDMIINGIMVVLEVGWLMFMVIKIYFWVLVIKVFIVS